MHLLTCILLSTVYLQYILYVVLNEVHTMGHLVLFALLGWSWNCPIPCCDIGKHSHWNYRGCIGCCNNKVFGASSQYVGRVWCVGGRVSGRVYVGVCVRMWVCGYGCLGVCVYVGAWVGLWVCGYGCLGGRVYVGVWAEE